MSIKRVRLITPRGGYTLLEVLAAIGITALLLGLLFSAVQKIRAAAARTECQNKLKEIGLALHNYHASHSQFPPGVTGDHPSSPMPYAGWCIRILPYLEKEPLWNQAVSAFSQNRDFLQNPPHTGLSTPVREFSCPSDSRVRQAQTAGNDQPQRAFTSFLGVVGYDAIRRDGVFFLDSQVRLSDISDGTSNTLAVGERPPSKDLMLGWWYAGWGQDKDGEGDMLLGVRTRNRTIYGPDCPFGPYEFQSGAFDNQCDAFHFWSPHSGGANFLFCDGSVRFLSYGANPIMPALASRAGGEAQSVP
jgi:prepilin-type processing-associated H-X9-DG protein